jgi:hypothetical protein
VVVLVFRVLLTLNAGTRARALRNAKTRLCMDGTNVQDGLHALLIVLTMCELLLVARIKTDTFLYAGKFHSAIYLRYTSGEKKYIYIRGQQVSVRTNHSVAGEERRGSGTSTAPYFFLPALFIAAASRPFKYFFGILRSSVNLTRRETGRERRERTTARRGGRGLGRE